MPKFLTHIRSFARLPNQELAYLLTRLTKVTYKAGEILLRPGDEGSKMLLVEAGLLKSYFTKPDGEIVLKGFFKPGDAAVDYPGFLGRSKSSIYIEALSDGWAYLRPAGLSAELYARGLGWQLVDLEVLQRTVLLLSQREDELISLTASERWDHLKTAFADVIDQIPKKDIAAFIGITPESFSRILKARP